MLTGQGLSIAAGLRIVDVWESEEDLAAAEEQLMSVIPQFGMTEEPEVYLAHTFATSSRARRRSGAGMRGPDPSNGSRVAARDHIRKSIAVRRTVPTTHLASGHRDE